MVHLLLIFFYKLYLKPTNKIFTMSKSVIDNRVSVSAIRKANNKRMGKKYSPSAHVRKNGEISIKFSTGLTTKQVILTRDRISSAYIKAVQKSAKRL